VAGSARLLARKKGLALEIEVAPEVGTITSDQRRVEQVLLNLLSNGIKFTEFGKVGLTARASGARVVLEVRDTGIGIREADLSHLFKPFRQIDIGIDRQHEGTGLGLSICKRLLDLLGGTIWVRSEWGKGSTFGFDLPVEGGHA
jgi:signal transduction histidine kinase